jgi:dolichol kinase
MERIKSLTLPSFPGFTGFFAGSGKGVELRTEVIRKTIHFLIALVPSMAVVNKPLTVITLTFGILAYTFMEYLRLSGISVPVVSSIVNMASRSRDAGHFVMGPVTLGLGALLAVILFPPSAAAIAIYALAFGDGVASLAGKFFGKMRPAFLFGKSIEGSLACFFAVFVCVYTVSGSAQIASIIALSTMVIEALPLEDYDNLAIPVTIGIVCLLCQTL